MLSFIMFSLVSNFVLPKIKIYYMYLRVDVYVASKQLFICFIQKGLVDLSGFVRYRILQLCNYCSPIACSSELLLFRSKLG